LVPNLETPDHAVSIVETDLATIILSCMLPTPGSTKYML